MEPQEWDIKETSMVATLKVRTITDMPKVRSRCKASTDNNNLMLPKIKVGMELLRDIIIKEINLKGITKVEIWMLNSLSRTCGFFLG
mmetsp:Transcript_25025/g.28590  ORF Transcript_25025/g.28590 Transcript_25025/m.28590 type:complete len:87 (-) Transcript_25025:1644-1904(-)